MKSEAVVSSPKGKEETGPERYPQSVSRELERYNSKGSTETVPRRGSAVQSREEAGKHHRDVPAKSPEGRGLAKLK